MRVHSAFLARRGALRQTVNVMRLLALTLLASTALAQTAPESTLVFRRWQRGFMSGPTWGRTSVTLTRRADGSAQLVLSTERPPDAQRKTLNPTSWTPVPERGGTLSSVGTKQRGARTTWWFDLPGGERFALICTPATETVHLAGADVDWANGCSPCYDDCKATPKWTPAGTTKRSGLKCQLMPDELVTEEGSPLERGDEPPVLPSLPGLESPPQWLFFSKAPGVELLIGRTDCPAEGLRVAR